MSEDRDEATGQFTPSTDGLFGREAEEAAAGFRPMPLKAGPVEPEGGEELSARDAADELNAKRGVDQGEEVFYQKTDTGERIPTDETVTAERAAADLAAYRNSKIESAAKSISGDFAAEIDKMRGEAIKANPEALGKHYGIDPALADEVGGEKADGAKEDVSRPAEEAEIAPDNAIDAVDGLDPETRKALKIPQVRQALEQHFAEVDQVREQYSASLQAGQQMMQATISALAPQLDGMPLEYWPQAIQQIAQVDPVRGQIVADTLTKWGAIQQAAQQSQQQRAHHEQQQFEATRQQYSRAADVALGNMTFAEKTEMAEELVAYVGEFGISREALMREAQTNLAIHHPAFQKMAADAISYRRLMNAPKAVLSRDVPPVVRPGASQHRSGNDVSGKLKGLEAQFASAEGDRAIRLAAQISQMKRSANRR